MQVLLCERERSPLPTRHATKTVKHPWFGGIYILILLVLAAFKSPTQSCFIQKRLSSVQQRHNDMEAKKPPEPEKVTKFILN